MNLPEFTSISIEFDAPRISERIQTPVRLGVPFQMGATRSLESLCVLDQLGQNVLTQTSVFATWDDRSIRWASIEFTQDPNCQYRLANLNAHASDRPTVQPKNAFSRQRAPCWQFLNAATHAKLECQVSMKINGEAVSVNVQKPNPIASGPVRYSWGADLRFERAQGSLVLDGSIVFHTYSESNLIHVELMVRNPNPSDHPGGNWDLGNDGSVFIEDLSFECSINAPSGESWIGATLGKEFEPIESASNLSLLQASSGGENWNSSNHIDKHREIPMKFRGFKCDVDNHSIEGNRADPIVSIHSNSAVVGVAYPNFWQSFPKAIRASENRISIGLFPQEAGYAHELQGGEQKTHLFTLEIRSPSEPSALASVHAPVICHLPLEAYQQAGVIDNLPSSTDQLSPLYESLVNLAIEGNNSFFAKREQIDEYGWRHFGDIYGDHEAVYHNGDSPMISHYNNQYDCTAGFAYQFLRTGDRRWWTQMLEMADHAWDIDTYHTDKDKLLYNGGLFWHTYHYADADTANHRSYPKNLRQSKDLHKGKDLSELGTTGKSLEKVYAVGGGPAASHNYPTGWMYAYFLTGEERYKTAAINAADYVIRIEDGRKTPFRWLSSSDTGYATCSSDNYYGPGRASGNSTHALLTGYELTLDPKYLDMAARLMRRTVHPQQNLEKLDLLNAELRWFYTMYLQSLCRYIEVLRRLPNRKSDLQYAVESLLHYVRWMVAHERPTLDAPEKLQYPNETWAAQDMRKWHVLAYAAKWCDTDEEAAKVMAKAEFFYHHSLETLDSFETKTLCRPLVLLMNFGWQRAALLKTPRMGKDWSKTEWPSFKSFVPQRQIAISRAKKIVIAGAGFGVIAVLSAIAWVLQAGSL